MDSLGLLISGGATSSEHYEVNISKNESVFVSLQLTQPEETEL